MRRKEAVALIAILVALSFAGVAFAATKTIAGEVISADASTRTLMIKAQGQEMTFSVVDNAAKALAKVKPGDKVTVSYTEADGEAYRALYYEELSRRERPRKSGSRCESRFFS